jgi:hypothetical protein
MPLWRARSPDRLIRPRGFETLRVVCVDENCTTEEVLEQLNGLPMELVAIRHQTVPARLHAVVGDL